MLSPFEVKSDRDTGFAASSSLAGGRLAGDLRDTPVAYSVITRDFIDALGITDLQSAAEWATSSTLNVDNGQQNFFASPVNCLSLAVSASARPSQSWSVGGAKGERCRSERQR